MQKSTFKDMSPEKKLKLAEYLYFSAKDLKKAALKAAHPEWNKEDLNRALKEIFTNAKS